MPEDKDDNTKSERTGYDGVRWIGRCCESATIEIRATLTGGNKICRLEMNTGNGWVEIQRED